MSLTLSHAAACTTGLDLFAQEVLSRAELISLVDDIFGSDNAHLLLEFDRLLASRGATDNASEDAWFSMPLSEIDFRECKRCTPSYRALPASYPKPPCSERTAMCRQACRIHPSNPTRTPTRHGRALRPSRPP